MVNAQEWLDKEYPLNRRSEKTELDISKGKVKKIFIHDSTLKGNLKLERFTNLRRLIISSHELTSLDISECRNLRELDCSGNQLNNLIVNGCSNFTKINCSNNNYIQELDLSSCTDLKEVDINGCSELTTDKIKSHLTYDSELGKLIKSGLKISKAKENDIRNILIIGITGNGKSALANTLSSTSTTNRFGESNSSTSETKNFQKSDIFEWQGKKYRIIDNIGFADTNNINVDDILFKIGEGINAAKEGLNQILFVFKGRFAPEQVMVFNLFKKFVAESRVNEFTTLVRTNFPNFRDDQKCEEDRQSLRNEKNKELNEIVNFCNGIIYVDNPPIPVIKDGDDKETIEDKKEEMFEVEEEREEVRKIILDHLAKNCSEIYKLKEWDSIVSMVNNYNRKKEQIEQSDSSNKEEDLRKAKNETAKEINQGIKFSIGAEALGIGGFNFAVEHNTQKKC